MPFGNTPFNPPDNVTITLTVNGELQAYQIKPSSSNLGVGGGALVNNTTGINDTAIGIDSMGSNVSGSENTAVGCLSLESNVSGSENTAVGYSALIDNISGNGNVALGYAALYNSGSNNNTAVGYEALFNNTTGEDNVAIGYLSLYSYDNTSSISGNIVAIGIKAGYNYTGSETNNIIIGNVLGTAGESNVIRIGSGIILGSDTQSTLTGITAGSVVSSQPFQSGSYKKFIAYASGYKNTTIIAQTISFPTAFLNQPVITANNTGMSLSVSTSGLTLPSATGTSSFTGIIIIEGY